MKKQTTSETTDDIRLSNGDVLIIRGKFFMVSTYGSQCDIDTENNHTGNVRNFCSLINLKDGSRVFKDPIPRSTKVSFILSKFYNMFDSALRNTEIRQIKRENYTIEISVK